MRIRKYGIIISVSFLSFFWSGYAAAADVAKIGIVNLQRIMETSNPGKSTSKVRSNSPLTCNRNHFFPLTCIDFYPHLAKL